MAAGLYLASILAWCGWKWADVAALGPEGLGEFLGGALGAVVFLWLVLGYHQQGEELKHNTQALELQAAELRELVGHNARMVEVAKEQLEADLKTIQVEAARLAEAARRAFISIHPATA